MKANTIKTTKAKFFSETLGLSPLKTRIRQSKLIFTGKEHVPSTNFGLSSLSQLKPSISFPLWLGKYRVKEKVIISNLFNHSPTPIEHGWSVKKTQVKDFRNKKLTYDSHNGTDFAVPINSTLLAPAAGKVVLIKSEFNRGGLKIVIDHGKNLLTCSVHLARAFVEEGQVVSRGEPIALTGYSGFDGFITCPFGIPHVHFNTWFNSLPVDPFAQNNQETSLWIGDQNLPLPINEISADSYTPSIPSSENLNRVIENCLDQCLKNELIKIQDDHLRACRVVFEMAYYPTLFPLKLNVWKHHLPRQERLSLPFHQQNFKGVIFMDEIV